MRKPVAVLGLAVALASCSSEPRTYEDCVLKAMDGSGKSDVAARMIAAACREKFPYRGADSHAADEVELSALQLLGLTGRAGLSFGKTYSGSIYNGNKDVTVTQVEISITTSVDGEEVTRTYLDEVNIPPLSTSDFSFDIIVGDTGADYSWGITGALGRKAK